MVGMSILGLVPFFVGSALILLEATESDDAGVAFGVGYVVSYALAAFLCGSLAPRRAWQWAVWLSLPPAAAGLVMLTDDGTAWRGAALFIGMTAGASLLGAYLGALLMAGTGPIPPRARRPQPETPTLAESPRRRARRDRR